MLHTVNKSPLERDTLQSCLAHAKAGSAVLLMEDAVYGATTGTTASDMVKDAMSNLTIYALQPDVEARGMAGKVIEGIKLVGYGEFVDLVTQHDTTQSWL